MMVRLRPAPAVFVVVVASPFLPFSDAGASVASTTPSWKVQSPPNVLYPNSNLQGIDCPSPSRCIAVGSAIGATGATFPL